MNPAHHIPHIDPTHPLPAVSSSAAEAQLEGQQHRSQRAALRTEHNSRSQVRRANVGLNRGRGSFLPLLANLRQKSRARRAFLAQRFITAVAVVTNRRSANKNLGLLFGSGQSRRQIQRSANATLSNLLFLSCGPSSENTFARKMNHGVKSRHRLRSDRHRGIPCDLPAVVVFRLGRSRAANHPHHGPPAAF